MTEWAGYQVARERGFQALHTDWARAHCPADGDTAEEVYFRALDWCPGGADDPTRYKGVSLGRMYATFLGCAYLDTARVDRALRHLCANHAIGRIVVFDISSTFHTLKLAAKSLLIQQIGMAFSIPVEERWDIPHIGDAAFFSRPIGPRVSPWTFRDRLRGGLGRIVEWAFRLAAVGRSAPRVFLYISTLSLRHLVTCRPDGILPVLPFEASPKSRTFLGTCLRHGIVPASLTQSPPTKKQIAACASMVEAVEDHWRKHPADPVGRVHRETVRETVLRLEILAELARTVDGLDKLITRLNVRRVVSGDASAPMGRALCELAQVRGLGADETLNGVFISPLRDPVRCSEDGGSSPVTRELALGPAIEKWLALSGTPLPSVVTGYPGLGRLKAVALARPATGKALVLPLYAWLNDTGGWPSKLSPNLVRMVRGLAQMGYGSIRIKIHPGLDNLKYYQWLVDHFDLPCTVDQTAAFADHLAWADLVVGPPGSGTFLETLAAGKPYYVLRPRPSAIPDVLLEGAVVGDTAEALCQAIGRGELPDRERILSLWCGLGQVTDPARAVWLAIAEKVLEVRS
ncbi:hypothetical protein [Magnetospira thiophila]